MTVHELIDRLKMLSSEQRELRVTAEWGEDLKIEEINHSGEDCISLVPVDPDEEYEEKESLDD